MNTNIITAKIVPESQRMDVADKHFGILFPLTVEPMIFQFATQLASAYSGGYWNFYTLSNGGFFMAPKLDESFQVIADNGFEGSMSAEPSCASSCCSAWARSRPYSPSLPWLRWHSFPRSCSSACLPYWPQFSL